MQQACLQLQHSQKGFTLVETLVYLAIMVVFLMSVVSFAASAISAGQKVQVQHEVQQNTRFALDRIVAEVRASNGINTGLSTFNAHPGVLVINTDAGTTIFDLSNGILRIDEGAGPINITTDEVNVTSLIFYDRSVTGKTQNISVEITVEWRDQASVEFTNTTTLRSSAVVRKGE